MYIFHSELLRPTPLKKKKSFAIFVCKIVTFLNETLFSWRQQKVLRRTVSITHRMEKNKNKKKISSVSQVSFLHGVGGRGNHPGSLSTDSQPLQENSRSMGFMESCLGDLSPRGPLLMGGANHDRLELCFLSLRETLFSSPKHVSNIFVRLCEKVDLLFRSFSLMFQFLPRFQLPCKL